MCKALDMAQHAGQRIGYARVSSTDQNLTRQLTALGEVNRVFEEKQSGAKREGRTALADLIGYARAGDVIFAGKWRCSVGAQWRPPFPDDAGGAALADVP